MPKLDHKIKAPIPNDNAESIQYCPVSRIAPAADNHGRGRNRVADFVQQRAADIHIAAGSPQQQRDGAIHHDASRRDPDH